MLKVETLIFNPFQENTYLVYDDTGEALIIDPGCHNSSEQKWLSQKIKTLRLKPVRLINTHCHIDHVLGNRYVAEEYGLSLEIPLKEVPVLNTVAQIAEMYGIAYNDPSPEPSGFLEEGKPIIFGNSTFEVYDTPGHSPGSVSLFHAPSKTLIAGDVLFKESIGRTDLPGGDYETLIQSIQQKLFTLPDETIVYPGHGPTTTIGYEKNHNPFLS
jgi:glyoxylase-like metal-dependent hydrolase (beta-lactamase superfamily II)